MLRRWRARLSVAAVFAAFYFLYAVLGDYGVSLHDAQMALLAFVVFGLIEMGRQDSLLPWWSLGAHVSSAGFAYLLWGPEEPRHSLFGLGLCALGAPLLLRIYRGRNNMQERDMKELEATLAAVKKELDEDLRREGGKD